MKCNYIASAIEEENYDTFISHLGERCKIYAEDMQCIDISQNMPASLQVWSAVGSDDFTIIDARKVNMSVSLVLYARYLKKPKKTFILLSPENEGKFSWGYGTGFCRFHVDENEKKRKLAKLQKDIAFYVGLDEEDDALKEGEPVREFLDCYWKNKNMESVPHCFNFGEIDMLEENSGEAIVSRLKFFSGERDEQGFKEEIKKIADNKDVTFDDYLKISYLCKDMNLKRYRVSVMEQGYQRWGKNLPQLTFGLIEAYADSSSRDDREKALGMAEEYFGITHDTEGMPVVNMDNRKIAVEENYVKSLFNTYIGLGKFDELYRLSEYEEQIIERAGISHLHLLFVRNRAICMKAQGDYEGALELFKELYEKDPSENTLNLIAITNSNAGRNKEAAKLFTMLILVNYNKDDPVLRLAEIMWNDSLFFDSASQSWNNSSSIIQNSQKQIVPLLFFLFSAEINQSNSHVIFEINRFLNMIKDTEAINYWNQNKENTGYLWSNFKKDSISEDYDLSLTKYLEDMHAKFVGSKAGLEEYIKSVLNSIY